MQPDHPMTALLDQHNIRVVQITDRKFRVIGDGYRVIYSGSDAKLRAYRKAVEWARELARRD